MNKMDLADEELVELVEDDIRDLLEKNGFDRDCPIIKVLLLKHSKAMKRMKTQSWSLLTQWTHTYQSQLAILTSHS